MNELKGLQPEKVFQFFEEISHIPRESGNEKNISDYLVDFALKRGLKYNQDKAYNVVIYKNSSKGYENSPILILQGHMDMVCEKNKNTHHDFLKDPLKLLVDGDFIKADGTTLGADNGIAIAYTLSILDSNDIEHPPIEAVFTSNEETGMNGARSFDMSTIKGKRLINIDTEEEGSLLVSCCGGVKKGIKLPIKREASKAGYMAYEISISGLKGGHSGSDIIKQRANAIKLMGRILRALKDVCSFNMASLSGGGKDNAIARESDCVILIDKNSVSIAEKVINKMQSYFIREYGVSESGINISFFPVNENIPRVFDENVTSNIISILLLIPQGINTMSLEIKNLVESSSNIGILKTEENYILFESAVRSSSPSIKEEICAKIEEIGKLTGAETYLFGDYPSWEFDKNSELLKIFSRTYKDMYGKDALVEAVHAGLECGLFAEKSADMDMISIGPDIFGAHSPDEKLSISSTERVWEYLLEILKRLK